MISDTYKRLLAAICPYLTIANLYVLTDWIIDLGLVTIPAPLDTCIYVLRTSVVIGLSVSKLIRPLFNRLQQTRRS